MSIRESIDKFKEEHNITSRTIDMLMPPDFGHLKLNDRVVTEHGKGTIVVINEAFVCVMHDDWAEGHNMPMLVGSTIKEFGEGKRCAIYDTRKANDGEVRKIES